MHRRALLAAAGTVVEDLSIGGGVHAYYETVTPAARASNSAQTPCVIWLTGLSGSGKSTIANFVERHLLDLGRKTVLLDGDNLRQGLNADLGFDEASRTENVRRTGELAKQLHDAGLIVIAALVSPFKADRARVASLLPPGRFLEVFIDAPIEVCGERDPKGLYAKADAGKIVNFTGLDQVYEPPAAPALWLRTDRISAEDSADHIVQLVIGREWRAARF
jgi:bifunctional enzyme CysN/CysC